MTAYTAAIGSSATLTSGLAIALQFPANPADLVAILSQVISYVLVLVAGYLFNASIRQGRELAALHRGTAAKEDVVSIKVLSEVHAGNIETLQAAAASVDTRIMESRHAIRNEVGALIGEMELRLDARLGELRQGQQELRHWLDRGGGRAP